MPANLLEAFIPGYGTFSTALPEARGFDITLLVSVSFLIFALLKIFDYLRREITNTITQLRACSVSLDSESDVYTWLMEWLVDKGGGKAHQGEEAYLQHEEDRRHSSTVCCTNF